ncbi:S-adenosyl-L-methionine-dependent methyltransferase [Mollisia scopiformis]|uniref:peptide chain release factor N(5)-glutamine methyltransferase n=1 Tax=Mollisia scopiformis TaxID=149040 RepID=A0A194WV20_MOLSC|nr:S-adenosyl-L-methionine-dependent methyltransferase [Mollisia scopiformis]KUJ11442.1 S-adenosyl-L-methionine-dependent methyltransferase [Mollisia scopiformis]
MPRLSHDLIRKAYSISSFLPLVLRGTRALDSAINELGWLKEHVFETSKTDCPKAHQKQLLQLCIRRSRAEPLQYILGSQPFGDLDIKCRPKVLIPRPETEAYTAHVAKLLLEDSLDVLSGPTRDSIDSEDQLHRRRAPKILDVCSGSGCISLLLHSLLVEKFKDISILGLDISKTAVNIARDNLRAYIKAKNFVQQPRQGHPQVQFRIHDVLSPTPIGFGHFDVILSNPPYISNSHFATETTRSVRNYEPRLALVPTFIPGVLLCKPEDIFYHRLLELYQTNKSSMLVMEIGDEEQARRVVQMALSTAQVSGSNGVEIWRDWPEQEPQPGEDTVMRIDGRSIAAGFPDVEKKSADGESDTRLRETIDGKGVRVEDTHIPIKGAGMIRTVILSRTKSVGQERP